MVEISYRCFCAAGALSNSRLYSRPLYTPDGRFIRMTYHDSGDGPLSHPGPCMKGLPGV